MSVVKVQAREEVVAAVLLRYLRPSCGDFLPGRVELRAWDTAPFGVEGGQLDGDGPVAIRGGYKVVGGGVEGDDAVACGCKVHKVAVSGCGEGERQGEEGEESLHVDV